MYSLLEVLKGWWLSDSNIFVLREPDEWWRCLEKLVIIVLNLVYLSKQKISLSLSVRTNKILFYSKMLETCIIISIRRLNHSQQWYGINSFSFPLETIFTSIVCPQTQLSAAINYSDAIFL